MGLSKKIRSRVRNSSCPAAELLCDAQPAGIAATPSQFVLATEISDHCPGANSLAKHGCKRFQSARNCCAVTHSSQIAAACCMPATMRRCSCPWNSYVGPGSVGWAVANGGLPPIHTVTATGTYGAKRRSQTERTIEKIHDTD